MPEQNQLTLSFDEAPVELLTPDEIFACEGTQLLRIAKEDRRIEAKGPQVDPRALGEYFSMWANTQPDGGVLLLGVASDRTVIGCKEIPHQRLNNLELAAEVYCPEAKYTTRRRPIKNKNGEEDFIVIYRVHYHKSKVVRTTKGDAFVRVGDQKHRLSSQKIRELEIDKGQIDLELEPAPYKYPQDFDKELLQNFARSWTTTRGVAGRNIREILQLNHLGKIEQDEFLPNVACALLFAKDPQRHFPGCKLRFLRFDGESERTGSEWNAVKDIWIDQDPVPKQLVRAAKLLQAQLRHFSRLDNDGKFYTAPEYPMEAWYEAIVNACCHRSYSLKNMIIFVKMFDDRLVIESPGGFPPLVTPQNIYDTHAPRNPRLMNGLLYLDFVKCAHEGTRRMRDRMIEMSLPKPEFQQKEGDFATVRVTLRNNIKQRKVWIDADVRDVVSDSILGDLDQMEKRAINFTAEHARINVSEMQRLTGYSWARSKKILMGLVKKGILHHNVREMIGTTGRDSKAHFVLRQAARESGC